MNGRTLLDKVWGEHVVVTSPQGEDLLYVDFNFINEGQSFLAFDQLRLEGRSTHRPQQHLAVTDHYLPTRNRERGIEGIENPGGNRQAGAFARAIGTEQPNDFTSPDLNGDILESDCRPIPDADVFQKQGQRSGHDPSADGNKTSVPKTGYTGVRRAASTRSEIQNSVCVAPRDGQICGHAEPQECGPTGGLSPCEEMRKRYKKGR